MTNFKQDGADAQSRTVNVDLVFTAGTSGAVPAALTVSNGILSVVKSSNNYVVTFQPGPVAYLNGCGHVIQASYAANGACRVVPSAQDVAGAGTVTLTCYESDGTATALASGDELHFTFRMKR